MTTTTGNGLASPLMANNGIAPYLLQHVAVGLKENDPSTKITPAGFLKLAIDNTPDFQIPEHEKLRLTTEGGQYRDIKLWYYKRANPSQVDETLECAVGEYNVRETFGISAPFIASRTIAFSNSDLAQYTEDAITTVKLGKAPTPFMQEVFKQIMTQCNAIAGKINQDLIGALQFGVNVVNGQHSKTINIGKNANEFDLNSGIPALLTDIQLNEMNGDALIAGAGFMLGYEQYKKISGSAANGVNIAETSGYQFYKDFYVPTKLGNANALAVFAPGTVGFVDLNTLVGFREQNLGVFQAFQIPLPVNTVDGQSTVMMFDVRMRFNACPTDIVDYQGNSRTVQEGWSIQISKQYGLFQTPTDLYGAGDRLAGSNGALKYILTNDL